MAGRAKVGRQLRRLVDKMTGRVNHVDYSSSGTTLECFATKADTARADLGGRCGVHGPHGQRGRTQRARSELGRTYGGCDIRSSSTSVSSSGLGRPSSQAGPARAPGVGHPRDAGREGRRPPARYPPDADLGPNTAHLLPDLCADITVAPCGLQGPRRPCLARCLVRVASCHDVSAHSLSDSFCTTPTLASAYFAALPTAAASQLYQVHQHLRRAPRSLMLPPGCDNIGR